MVQLLSRAGRGTEALALGRKLRDRGLLTLDIARQLGDVLARAKLKDEALRTYSEIVEFDPANVTSRRLLGDIYLARGWYSPAYRQYQSAVAAAPSDPLLSLRLASAAAGTGRIDEALRLERRVSTAQGRPGPDDPRRWARLLSAARVARLIAKPPAHRPPPPAALKRKLKELQLFDGPGKLVLVVWEDLARNLMLLGQKEEKQVALGEPYDAAPVGLSALMLRPGALDGVELVARLRSLPALEPLSLLRCDINFDGKDFVVTVKAHELPASKTKLLL